MDMTAEYETTINRLLAENDKLIKLVDWQNDEIERLREALREIVEFKHPDRHGYELQDIAIAALKESGDG